MFRRTLGAAIACVLICSAPASAGTPTTIGEGSRPHVITDADGSAHLVWINSSAGTLTYCHVPRGAGACDRARNLPQPGGVSGAPAATYILRSSGGNLVAVMPVFGADRTYSWASTDNGVTWTGPNRIHDAVPMLNPSSEPFAGLLGNDVVFASAGAIVWRSNGTADQNKTTHADLAGGGTDFAIAKVGTNRVVGAGSQDGTTTYRNTDGNDPPEIAGNWSPAKTIPGELDTTRVASGPSGAFLFGSAGPVSDPRQEIRRFDANTNTFGPPTVLANEIGYVNDVSVGASGAVAAIWRRNEPSGGNRLQLALSPGGAGPWAVSTIAREDVVMSDMDVSLAPDNAGWAVYEGVGGGATSQIRLADLTAIPEPAAPGDGGGGTPVTPVTPVTPPTPPTPPRPPAVKRITASVKGATLTLGVPRACIPSGRPFVATLTWKKQRRKGNLFVKVRRTDFYVGKKRLKIDKKAPFRQTLRIPNPKKGQKYSFRARAFIKVKRGAGPKKSIRTTLTVCR